MPNISDQQRERLNTAYNKFIIVIRLWVADKMKTSFGDGRWEDIYVDMLYPNQKDIWETNRGDGDQPEDLIDFGHLKQFSLKYKDLLKDEFGKRINRVPTWFEEINEVRNDIAHHCPIEIDMSKRALANMILISKALKNESLSTFLTSVKEEAPEPQEDDQPTIEPETVEIEEEKEIEQIEESVESLDEGISMDDLDEKLLEDFKGYVVKKNLVRMIKVGSNVPVFVLEYLIANSASTKDPEKIKEGLTNVKKVLADHYVNPEESALIHSKIRERGRFTIIDKISVRLDSKRDRYWAHLRNSNITDANIPDVLVNEHEKMMLGGIWAIIDVEYDPNIYIGNSIYPFVISSINPIQISDFKNDKLVSKRKNYSKEEWVNILLRSCGYEPTSEGMTDRVKMLLISRMLPLVESNFNFVELGPRSTGKSFMFKELTPYAVLISGGQGTVAKLFVHGGTGKVGAVGQWDAICFDEATDKIFKDRDAIPLMKDYLESGSFSRAGEGGEITGVASIVLNGNINQPVETVLQTSHLFSPLSEEVNSDTAFLDRIHFYLPGWEMIKFYPSNFTSNFGFSTDYFSECLKSFRRVTYVDALEEYFSLGSHLKQRDTKPVKKTVSGFIKLMHPDGNYTKEDIRQYLEIAIEMRRRVKEQLKRIGGMEFWDTNFSYIDKETQEEHFVGLPEEKGSHLIESTPLPPGVCYTSTSDGTNLALVKIEVVSTHGSGKLNITGVNNNKIKEDIKNTYQYIKANEKTILNEKYKLADTDISVQVTNMLGSQMSSGIGSAVYISIISAIYKKNLKAGLAVLGSISVGGAIERSLHFTDKLSMLSENGAKTVAVPMDNLKELADIPPSILGSTDVPFYSNNNMLMQKGILLE